MDCCFSSLFFSFFPFHHLFFPKLVRPSMLSFWTFTPGSFHSVFLYVFSLHLFSFLGGIYKVLLEFFMNLNINWSKLSSLIKIREFWKNINNWNLCPSMVFGWWFCNKFAWVILFYIETKACIPHLLIWDERFMTLDKNHLRIFKCEQMSILVKAN
jgi:hypothetical protein